MLAVYELKKAYVFCEGNDVPLSIQAKVALEHGYNSKEIYTSGRVNVTPRRRGLATLFSGITRWEAIIGNDAVNLITHFRSVVAIRFYAAWVEPTQELLRPGEYRPIGDTSLFRRHIRTSRIIANVEPRDIVDAPQITSVENNSLRAN